MMRRRECPPLASQRERAVGVPVELGPELHQLPDALRPFGDEHAHGVLVAQARARDERILHVQLDVIVGRHDARDAALRPVGVAVRAVLLSDQGNAALLGGAEGEGESGAAAAEHEEVKVRHGE